MFEYFDKVEWCGYKWIKRPLWGDNHQAERHCWYDQECIDFNDGNVVLNLRRNPKLCDVPNEGQVLKEFGKGSMRTIEEFKYGTFEWEMKVPEGKYLWPALWLASDYSWPPEIDCMEGWSKENPKYVKRLLWKNIRPTTHWSANCDPVNGEHKSEAKFNVWRWWLKCDGFDNYKVIWTPDYVDVFYNNHKVQRFQDREMLRHMNLPEVKMHAIQSININESFVDYYDDYVRRNKPMIVKSFKHTPLA